MKEVKKIGAHVLKQISYEKEQSVRQKAEMRVEALFNHDSKIFWLYSKDYQPQRTARRNIHGELTGFDPLHHPPESVQIDDGERISKNSLLGGELIKNRCKRFTYTAPAGDQEVEAKNITIYTPHIGVNIVDAKTGEIQIDGEEQIRFNSLKKLLKQYEDQLRKERLQKELADEKEKEKAAVLQNQILELEQQIESELEQQQRYIRESTELRMQPILDPKQETIKRSKILNGMLIIDGGPGTGKTTTLIQRINFLTASTVKEYKDDLSDEEVSALEGNWRFFSPSRLLKLFLKNSMASEGLNTNDQYTKVWSEYVDQVYKKYTLFNPSTQNPFIKAHSFTTPVLPNNCSILLDLFKLIETALLEDIRKRLNRVIESNIKELTWEENGEKFKRKANSALNKDSIVEFIKQFEDWRRDEWEAVKDELKDLNDKLTLLSSRVQLRVKENEPDLYYEITEYLEERFEKRHEIDADEEEDEEDDFDAEETPLQTFNADLELSRFFRRLTSAKSLRVLAKGFRKTKVLRDWGDQIEFAFENIDLTEIGELIYFRRFTNRMIAGGGTAVLSRIPTVYKQIRSDIADYLEQKGYGNDDFRALIEKDRKRLHTDEMNLVLWFINQCIKDLKISYGRIFENMDHNYVAGFKEEMKSVIAVDEATDFSSLEIVTISSFADPKYNSVTLSGDLMQRMTSSGIIDWDVIKKLFPDASVERLTVSYRQSPTLLRLASQLYKNVTGIEPDFKAYIPESKGEPKPKVVQLKFENISSWLEDQIVKVYSMYEGNIPSVAIFAESDETVVKIAKSLQASDRLKDVGISVRYSTSDSELVPDSQVCTYNIKNIKGLEFEAVFFVNIDCLNVSDQELLQKYLYVGLSRAAYYLGVSYRTELPESLRFLEHE